MSLLSKLEEKNTRKAEKSQEAVEDFVSLIRIYYQAVMAVNMGITNVNFVPDLMMFKRVLKIATQNGKLGVAEKSQARKMLMQNYGLNEAFFKEIDASVKKNCKTPNDIQSYFFQFQGFSNDLLTVIGNLMQWKFQLPLFLKKLLYSMTQKTIHDIVTKSDWKDVSVRKTVTGIRKYKNTLGFSEEWMTNFVFNIVILAKKGKKDKKVTKE